VSPQLQHVYGFDVGPAEADRPLGGVGEPVEQAQQAGLPRPGGTNDRGRTRNDLARHAGEDLGCAAGHGHLIELKDRLVAVARALVLVRADRDVTGSRGARPGP
jgi:hypothetical protein